MGVKWNGKISIGVGLTKNVETWNGFNGNGIRVWRDWLKQMIMDSLHFFFASIPFCQKFWKLFISLRSLHSKIVLNSFTPQGVVVLFFTKHGTLKDDFQLKWTNKQQLIEVNLNVLPPFLRICLLLKSLYDFNIIDTFWGFLYSASRLCLTSPWFHPICCQCLHNSHKLNAKCFHIFLFFAR